MLKKKSWYKKSVQNTVFLIKKKSNDPFSSIKFRIWFSIIIKKYLMFTVVNSPLFEYHYFGIKLLAFFNERLFGVK